LSQWHLVFSRMARMYAPFLFFYLAAVFALLLWARTGRVRWLLCALPLSLCAAIMHLSGVLVVLIALLPLVMPVREARGTVPLIAPVVFAFAVVAATLACEHYFVAPPYAGWTMNAADLNPSADAPPGSHAGGAMGIVLIILGAVVAAWTTARTRPDSSGMLATLVLHGSAVVAGALLGAGQLYGAALAIGVWLLLSQHPRLPPAHYALLALVAAAGTWLALTGGAWRNDAHGWRALTAFPQPYGVLLARDHKVLALLVAAGMAGLALRTRETRDDALRLIALAILIILAALGLSDRTPERRYALSVYPLLLLVAAPVLLQLCALPQRWLPRWRTHHALVAASVIVLIGGIGAHGVRSALLIARLEHGQTEGSRRAGYPPLPDHAAAGRFVRGMRGVDDVVIAEDPISQRWYAERADYSFRAPALMSPYVYRAADGRIRDQYVNAELAIDPALLDSVVAAARQRVWYITNAEMAPVRRNHFSARQYAWVDSLERVRSPVFTARDGITRVYCLNCAQ
jgi:hypothetical protein